MTALLWLVGCGHGLRASSLLHHVKACWNQDIRFFMPRLLASHYNVRSGPATDVHIMSVLLLLDSYDNGLDWPSSS